MLLPQALIFDRRNELDGPGLHALVVGVSAYTYLLEPDAPGEGDQAPGFGMRRLSSTSLTALKICDWLIDHKDSLAVPLASCRLLVSPTASEIATEQRLSNQGVAANLRNVLRAARDWRKDAETRRENVTFFYFAGHGLQRTRADQVLLLEDFAEPGGSALQNAVDTSSLRSGMAPTMNRQDIARTQYYFIDACRDQPKPIAKFEEMKCTPVFDVEELDLVDNRIAPIFYASIPGEQARSTRRQTFFSQALLECLDGTAAEPPDDTATQQWKVTYHSLSSILTSSINDLNQRMGTTQQFIADGFGSDVPICFLDQPPTVPTTVEVTPDAALMYAQLEVLDDNDAVAWSTPLPLAPHPFSNQLKAGIYRLRTNIVPPTSGFVAPRTLSVHVMPRQAKWRLDVQSGKLSVTRA